MVVNVYYINNWNFAIISSWIVIKISDTNFPPVSKLVIFNWVQIRCV